MLFLVFVFLSVFERVSSWTSGTTNSYLCYFQEKIRHRFWTTGNCYTRLYDEVGTRARLQLGACLWVLCAFLGSVPCQDTSHPAVQHPGVPAAPGPPVPDGAPQRLHQEAVLLAKSRSCARHLRFAGVCVIVPALQLRHTCQCEARNYGAEPPHIMYRHFCGRNKRATQVQNQKFTLPVSWLQW